MTIRITLTIGIVLIHCISVYSLSGGNKATINNVSTARLPSNIQNSSSYVYFSNFMSEAENVTDCPTWTYKHNSGGCECVHKNDQVHTTVLCDYEARILSVLSCYCLSLYEKSLTVGRTLYRCTPAGHGADHYRNRIPWNISLAKLDRIMCSKMGRTGTLCGQCLMNESLALPVYSYKLECVKCTDYRLNWIKYIGVAFIPLTGFFIVMILFRASITNGMLNCCIFVFQVVSMPAFIREVYVILRAYNKQTITLNIASSVFGIWNLDFFRSVYPLFCLHPKLSTLQMLAMDYAIAVYPFLLILITCLLVKAHDNVRLAVIMWKPIYWGFARFRRDWDIKTSLVSAFVSFLQLSYVKILSVSSDILHGSSLFNNKGDRLEIVLLYDGTVKYFGHEHAPYAVLAVLMLFIFNFLPLMLLFLYPCSCFQRLLNHFRCRCQALHIFMDAVYQGCYKTKPNYCRHFAAMYFVLRITNVILFNFFDTYVYCFLAAMTFLFALALTATVRPYKIQLHNISDTLLLLLLSSAFLMIPLFYMLYEWSYWFHRVPICLGVVFVSLIAIQTVAILIYHCLPKKWFRKVIEIVQRIVNKCCCRRDSRETEPHDESLPYRLQQDRNERSPLLRVQ